MLVVGVVALICFAIWDGRFASKPIVPLSLMKRGTVVVACLLGAFDLLAYSVFTIFFRSFLQVAGGYAPSKAALIKSVH